MKVETVVRSKGKIGSNVNGSRLVAHKIAATVLDDYFYRVTSCVCIGRHFFIFYYLISRLLRPPGPWKKREESHIFSFFKFFRGVPFGPISLSRPCSSFWVCTVGRI